MYFYKWLISVESVPDIDFDKVGLSLKSVIVKSERGVIEN